MSSLIRLWRVMVAVCLLAGPAPAAFAQSQVELALREPVPWRAFTAEAPYRMIVDVAGAAEAPRISGARGLTLARSGAIAPEWNRFVFLMEGPHAIATAALDRETVLRLDLQPVDPEAFVVSPPPASRLFRQSDLPPEIAPKPSGRLRVVLDPGHGGIDPGAEAGGIREAHLMLAFAQELQEALEPTGVFDVILTRDADVFVPLERRLTIARAAEADVFLSLHADALEIGSGSATGATIYTLSTEASDAASQRLAERHDADDLMAGLDLSGQGDDVALILMDLARAATTPRSTALAEELVAGITARTGRMNHRPRRSAAFSVLKSPDIPSALVELGFLSSPQDREKLSDPVWRVLAAEGIRDALLNWAAADPRLQARLAQSGR